MGRTVHIMPPKIGHPRSKPWTEQHIIYCLAGRTAEKKLAPKHWDDTDDMRSAADLAEAQEYVSRMLSAERAANTPYIGSVGAYQSWMQARTDALIVREWETVAAVAEELLVCREIREHQLRQVIATAKAKGDSAR